LKLSLKASTLSLPPLTCCGNFALPELELALTRRRLLLLPRHPSEPSCWWALVEEHQDYGRLILCWNNVKGAPIYARSRRKQREGRFAIEGPQGQLGRTSNRPAPALCRTKGPAEGFSARQLVCRWFGQGSRVGIAPTNPINPPGFPTVWLVTLVGPRTTPAFGCQPRTHDPMQHTHGQ
jgi:hypothetical protein